jgi:transcriptional regulator with XRE-family HTH domain
MRAQVDIGQRIRGHRRANRLSLREISDQTGISVSSLSKIENNIVELSYSRMIAISEAIGINLTELVGDGQGASPQPSTSVTARRSITKSGTGLVGDAKNYVYEYLNVDISKKRMIPTVATVKARSMAEYGELSTHRGEEFVIVLEGDVELHTEHYEPLKLSKGDSIYIDSTMPHAMISVGKDLARILFVCTHAIAGPGSHEDAQEKTSRGSPPKASRVTGKNGRTKAAK